MKTERKRMKTVSKRQQHSGGLIWTCQRCKGTLTLVALLDADDHCNTKRAVHETQPKVVVVVALNSCAVK